LGWRVSAAATSNAKKQRRKIPAFAVLGTGSHAGSAAAAGHWIYRRYLLGRQAFRGAFVGAATAAGGIV
jgi:hypothetical protein